MTRLWAVPSVLKTSLPLMFFATVLSPSAQAATLIHSFTRAELSNFSLNGMAIAPFQTDSNTDTDAIVIGGRSAVISTSDAEAEFLVQPSQLKAFTAASANGVGTIPYLGQPEAVAGAEGAFLVEGLFQFDFSTILNLEAAVDDPKHERALSAGNIQFSLFQTTEQGTELIDDFSLSGLLSSTTDEDLFGVNRSEHFYLPLSSLSCSRPGGNCFRDSLGGQREFADATLHGYYQRNFETPTLLTLVTQQISITRVEAVPEPGLLWPLGFLGLGLVIRCRKLAQRQTVTES